MSRAAPFLLSALLLALLACEETLLPMEGGPPPTASDSVTIPLGGYIDFTDGIRYYRDVHVEGTLTYHTTFFDEAGRSEVGVFLHVAMKFRRTNDYQGITQNWHAGGKSNNILRLGEDGTALTHKFYQLWGVANSVFVNMEFLIQQSDVRVHSIWVTYEYPD